MSGTFLGFSYMVVFKTVVTIVCHENQNMIREIGKQMILTDIPAIKIKLEILRKFSHKRHRTGYKVPLL